MKPEAVPQNPRKEFHMEEGEASQITRIAREAGKEMEEQRKNRLGVEGQEEESQVVIAELIADRFAGIQRENEKDQEYILDE